MKNRSPRTFILILVLACAQFAFADPALSFTSIVKNAPRAAEFIKNLAHLGETKGSKYVMEGLEQGAKGLSGAARTRYMQENLLKVLVAQNRISKTQDDEWMRNLGNVPGFEKNLKTMVGKGDPSRFGHGFELETANELHRRGYKIKEIGKTFNDGIKGGNTDIDLIASKGSKTYIFEIKDYKPKNIDILNPPPGMKLKPSDVIRNDMQTLNVYRERNPGVTPVFIFKNKPPNSTSLDWINANGKRNDIKVLYGEPSVVAKLLDLM